MLTHSYDEPVCKPIVGGPTILDGRHYFYMQTMLNYNRVQYKVFCSMMRWRTDSVILCGSWGSTRSQELGHQPFI